MLAVQAHGCAVTTIEGLAKDGALHPVQEAFVNGFALQCGFCTPGFVMAAHALLERNPDPTEEEIRHDLSSNLCMCTGYVQIVEAITRLVGGGLHPSTNARGALNGVDGQASGAAKT